MKFRCERDTLSEAVATAQRAVASRPGALPVLSDLRITATADGVELVGSDLEITNRVPFPAMVEETGVAVVPKILGDIVKRLEPGTVTVSIDGEEAHVAAGKSVTTLRLKSADDYPRIAPAEGDGVRVDARTLIGALRQVVKVASKDHDRHLSLTGVLLSAHGGGLRLVATDSYRLAVRDLKGVSMLPEGKKVLVAAKGLAEVQRLAGEGEIEVLLGERDVAFRTQRAEVVVRLIEGEFPKYEQLIPSGYPNRLIANKESFLDALDRVAIVGQGRDNANLRLTMSPSGIEMTMAVADVGSSEEPIDAKYEGSELTVAFNPQFLREGVEAIEAEEFTLSTIDPLKPATLQSSDSDDFLYLVMPVRTP